jgi:hypothetical protein
MRSTTFLDREVPAKFCGTSQRYTLPVNFWNKTRCSLPYPIATIFILCKQIFGPRIQAWGKYRLRSKRWIGRSVFQSYAIILRGKVIASIRAFNLAASSCSTLTILVECILISVYKYCQKVSVFTTWTFSSTMSKDCLLTRFDDICHNVRWQFRLERDADSCAFNAKPSQNSDSSLSQKSGQGIYNRRDCCRY